MNIDAMEPGTVLWLTGLSGAGKTTIGRLLHEKMYARKKNVFRLDGDIGRIAYNDKIGYDAASREEGAYRNARVCKMIADQGIDVICCTVSMFHGVRAWNRAHMKHYVEIFLDVPMDVLMARDQKGLYSRVRAGQEKNVVGLDMRTELPQHPDIRLVNDGSEAPEAVAAYLYELLMARKGGRA